MVYELLWLRGEALIEARQFATFKEAQRDLDQLSNFYREKLGATHAEIWEDDALRYSRGLKL